MDICIVNVSKEISDGLTINYTRNGIIVYISQ